MTKSLMRAVGVIPGMREVRLMEHQTPHIAEPSQVKIRSLEVGVCGTDREICTFVYGSPPDGFDYLVLGHESLGEVIEVGSCVPPELRDVAVLVEPLTVAEKGLAQVRRIQQRLPWLDPETPAGQFGAGKNALVLSSSIAPRM